MTTEKKYIGVKKRHGAGNYEARSVILGETRHIGTFQTAEKAAQARDIYLLLNHPKPESVTLNNPILATYSPADLQALMPEPTGTVLQSKGDREPLSATGHRYIHQKGDLYVFRASFMEGKRRKYVRKQFSDIKKAMVARKKTMGIPIPAGV